MALYLKRKLRKSPAKRRAFPFVKTTKGMGEIFHGQTKGYKVFVILFTILS
ncbi:hypothetical protein B4168_2929 [Anoxybacillus flavithermus]|nr:hypothetical protein B4168_2929 [Anoxybacillus flavithermus]OAO86218.1 hypothetical protein GT23_2111 [Parageobacillus thermoglucosidasius]